jgi:hypothetical protein
MVIKKYNNEKEFGLNLNDRTSLIYSPQSYSFVFKLNESVCSALKEIIHFSRPEVLCLVLTRALHWILSRIEQFHFHVLTPYIPKYI